MATATLNGFYMGVRTELDQTEAWGSYYADHASSALGWTAGSAGAPLYDNQVQVTLNDPNNNGATGANSWGVAGENVTYNGTSAELDTAINYDVTITYWDGSTATGNIVLIQDINDRVFLLPHTAGPTNDPFKAAAIQSITLDSVTGDTFTGVSTSLENIDFACFGLGTMIAMPGGERPVEAIVAGDTVQTAGGGLAKVLIVTKRVTPWAEMAKEQRLWPVRIAAGAMGQGLPHHDLVVSPQHRMLVASPIVCRMLDHGETLVPAIRLVGLPGITQFLPEGDITWCHLLLDHHDVILAEGAPAESLLLGPELRRAMLDNGALSAAGVLLLGRLSKGRVSARTLCSGHKARSLTARHSKNARELLQCWPCNHCPTVVRPCEIA